MKPAYFVLGFFLCSSMLRAGSHIVATTVIDGFFYPDASVEGVYYFQSGDHTERFDISGRAFLTASGVYLPEIPGLSNLNIRATKDGKADIREKDAAAIRALAARHKSQLHIFRAADTGLFFVLRTGKTPTRKIIIESERGDFVIIWRNRLE